MGLNDTNGGEPTLAIEDEVQKLVDMSNLLDALQNTRVQRPPVPKKIKPTSMKIRDKSERRAKTKKARSSRRNNRG